MFESLGQYKILERIGAGGMGEVYRARDTRHGRTVAIKVLPAAIADDPARREPFLRDARAAAALSHPNIAALYEIGEDQGHLFLAFEFVPGETLNTVISGRPINPRRAIDLACQVADALADAHAEGIIHRDLKPANIIVTPKGNAKVLDFGLAAWTSGGAERDHAADAATAAPAASAAATPGTAAYLSPEQALGEAVDHRTDIFSLGIVMFEMLTGRPPFAGTTATAVALQIAQAPAPVPSRVNKSIPVELDVIVERALAKSLDQRYESAVTLAAEIRSVGAILDVRSDAAPPAFVPPTLASRRRSYGGLIVLLLVLAAFAAAAWFGRDAIERLWRRTLASSPPPVIAVLPLSLEGSDPAQTYFADGLTEDLISRLGQTPGLSVLGRSATRTYRGRSPGDVAREVGAGVVLIGSVRPSSETVKVSLELIDPADGAALWSGQYTKEARNIFAVQALAAGEVASALRVKPQPTRASEAALSRVVDERAYDLYLRGRQAAAEHRLPDAIGLYEQSIAADAGLGEAFAGIAEALHLQVIVAGAADDTVNRTRLRTAASRAYELDPDLPQANVAMALAGDTLAGTLKFLRRAVELDPSYADAYHVIGDELHDFDPERAIAFFRKSLLLDPRLDASHSDIASALALAGRTADARKELGAMHAAAAGSPLVTALVALTDLQSGQYAAAASTLAAMPTVRAAPPFWSALVAAFRLAGRVDDAFAEATALAAKFPQDCEARALLAALHGERREMPAAHTLADGPLAVAGLESPLPADVRCGLHAAAALQNGARAAALLTRVASQEPLLRAFAALVMGQSGSMWINPRLYPWSLVAKQPAVVAARETVDQAYTREREIATTALAGLP